MATLKTQPNKNSVAKFLNGVDDEIKREDCLEIARLMEEKIGCKPVMWGDSIVGYGKYHYRYESGREGDFFRIGFSPRKQNIVLYIMNGFDRYPDLMSGLGRHKTGKSCLYIKKLSDVDRTVLERLIIESLLHFEKKYGAN